MLPEAKRLSRTAETVSQFSPATRQGISTPSSQLADGADHIDGRA
jgi:hypothetical protein